ncbi:DMT family transporter [Anaerosporobacter sp.]
MNIVQDNKTRGHLAALFTIIVWGTTFISTKILLRDFSPVEILFIRFVIGYIALWIAYPKPLRITNKKQEILFAAAGLCGLTLYQLFENIALTYTPASNVSVIISIAPFFTAILGFLLLKEEKPNLRFFIAFGIAIAGICLISFNNNTSLSINPLGDLLAISDSILWAFYSIITKKLSSFHYNMIQTTRRIFFYAILFMIPLLFVMDFQLSLKPLTNVTNLFNLIFLGLCASALCFVTWNFAVRHIGTMKTSVYIYGVPVITAITSAIILHETISLTTICGIVLTLVGLYLSEKKN